MPGHAAGVAAAMKPERLETAVVMAGGGSMYDSQFQRGVPFFAHFTSPLGADVCGRLILPQPPGRAIDKVWMRPWGHTISTRGEQWTAALHAWFDRHLQERAVPTGPDVEAFFDTGDVLTADAWTPPSARAPGWSCASGQAATITSLRPT